MVACHVVPGYRGSVRHSNDRKPPSSLPFSGTKKISGLLCLAMLAPEHQNFHNHDKHEGEQEGDAAAGPPAPIKPSNNKEDDDDDGHDFDNDHDDHYDNDDHDDNNGNNINNGNTDDHDEMDNNHSTSSNNNNNNSNINHGNNDSEATSTAGTTDAPPPTPPPPPPPPASPAAVIGLLNVYKLKSNHKGSDLEDGVLLQQEPQQIVLPYAPAGITHVPVWRDAAPSFDDASAKTSSMSPAALPSANRSQERGDVIFVWGSDGEVRGYVRWESAALAGGSRRKSGSRVGGGGGGGGRPKAVLNEEPMERLELLIPEMKKIKGVPILNMLVESATAGVCAGDGSGRVVRQHIRNTMVGYGDGALYFSAIECANSRAQTVACSSLNGGVTGLALNTPCFSINSSGADRRGGNIVGFACGRLGMVTCFTEEDTSTCEELDGRQEATENGEPAAATVASTTGNAQMAGTDSALCVACADFCRDGTTTVAVGSSAGIVTVYDVLQEFGGNYGRDRPSIRSRVEDGQPGGGWGSDRTDSYDGAFDDDFQEFMQEALMLQETPRRNDSSSPRPPGPVDRRFSGRISGSGIRQSLMASSNNNNMPRHMAFKWQKHVPHPVLGITTGDFNHDGIEEMVVITMFGVHVLRPDYEEEAARLRNTLNALRLLQPQEEAGGVERVTGDGGISSSCDEPGGGDGGGGVSSSNDEAVQHPSLVAVREQ